MANTYESADGAQIVCVSWGGSENGTRVELLQDAYQVRMDELLYCAGQPDATLAQLAGKSGAYRCDPFCIAHRTGRHHDSCAQRPSWQNRGK